MTTSKKSPNRGGRPRNPDLDRLAVSRRRAAQLLKEQMAHPIDGKILRHYWGTRRFQVPSRNLPVALTDHPSDGQTCESAKLIFQSA